MQRWNNQVMFPKDSGFINRITDITFAPSNKGNPMLTIELELISPESVMVGENEIDISGITTKTYFNTQTLNPDGSVNEEKSENNKKRCKELYTNLFPDDPSRAANFDPTNPDTTGIKGLCVFCEMEPDVETKRKNPTTEEIAKAKKNGTDVREAGAVMKHPITGAPLVNYWPRTVQIFGLAPQGAAAGKPY